MRGPAASGRAFADLTAPQQIELMRVYDRDAYRPGPDRHFFRTLKDGEWVVTEERTYDPKAVYGGTK